MEWRYIDYTGCSGGYPDSALASSSCMVMATFLLYAKDGDTTGMDTSELFSGRDGFDWRQRVLSVYFVDCTFDFGRREALI